MRQNPNSYVQDRLFEGPVDDMLRNTSSFGFSDESDEDYISRLMNQWDKDVEQKEGHGVGEDNLTTDVVQSPGQSTFSPRRSQRLKDRKSSNGFAPPQPRL